MYSYRYNLPLSLSEKKTTYLYQAKLSKKYSFINQKHKRLFQKDKNINLLSCSQLASGDI
jgi:hypothetical protein